jgi:hypothetical protein
LGQEAGEDMGEKPPGFLLITRIFHALGSSPYRIYKVLLISSCVSCNVEELTYLTRQAGLGLAGSTQLVTEREICTRKDQSRAYGASVNDIFSNVVRDTADVGAGFVDGNVGW